MPSRRTPFSSSRRPATDSRTRLTRFLKLGRRPVLEKARAFEYLGGSEMSLSSRTKVRMSPRLRSARFARLTRLGRAMEVYSARASHEERDGGGRLLEPSHTSSLQPPLRLVRLNLAFDELEFTLAGQEADVFGAQPSERGELDGANREALSELDSRPGRD